MNIMSSLKQIGRPKTDDAAWSLPEKYGGSLNKRTGKRLTKFGGWVGVPQDPERYRTRSSLDL